MIEAGATFALDKTTGKVVWESQIPAGAWHSDCFSPDGKNPLAVLKTDGLVILDLQNGKTLDFVPWETSYRTNASTPIVRGNKLFFNRLSADVPCSNGKRIAWRKSTKTRIYPPI